MQQNTIDPLTLIKQSLAVYKCRYIACENTFHTSVAHITYVLRGGTTGWAGWALAHPVFQRSEANIPQNCKICATSLHLL